MTKDDDPRGWCSGGFKGFLDWGVSMMTKRKWNAQQSPVNPGLTRRGVLGGVGLVAGMVTAGPAAASSKLGCSTWRQPNDADFTATYGHEKTAFLDRVLGAIESEVAPKTRIGVSEGNKLFGAAILRKSDLSSVVIATNTETGNPLLHGEIQAINQFYDLSAEDRPAPSDCVFIATHEPCPLCLSGISWGGFDNFVYLFTYEDSRDAYGIPHDIVMLDEVFRAPDGSYSEKNKYWNSWSIRDLIASLPADQSTAFSDRVAELQKVYAELSDVYQKAKSEGRGANVPLK